MSFVDVKLLNSDFKDEPLNYLSYIDSIEKYGDESYVFDVRSKRILRDLLSNSTLLFSHKQIFPTLLKNLKSDDLYYFFKKNQNVGDCLNALIGENLFSTGSFDNICEYMNMTAIHSLNNEFLHAFGMCVTDRLNSDGALDWIQLRFGLDLSEYGTLSDAILNEEAWRTMLQNSTMMSCVTSSDWFINQVVDRARIRIWRTSDGNYYDDDGVQYSGSTGEKTGTTIAVDTLNVMKQTGLVTEDYMVLRDSAYQRIKEALYWLAQNEFISSIMGNKELIAAFLEDDTCCQYLVDHPDTMLNNALKDAEFAKQIFHSDLLFSKIGESDAATRVLAQFITDIQVSYDALEIIKDSIALIPENSDKIYDANPILEQVNDTLDKVNDVMTKITACQNYTTITESNITTFMHDPEITAKMFANALFVKWAASSTVFSREIVKNSVIGNVLSTDERTYPIALADTTFVNALFADNSLYESVWIGTERKRGIIYESENAMEMLCENEDYTRRFINKHLKYDDSLFPSLSDNFNNSTWTSAAAGVEFLMDFMCHNLACANYIVDSETAMNSIYGQEYPEHYETEMMYQAMIRHGDVGFFKWLIQKAGLSTPNYNSYASLTAYVAQMTNGTIILAGFKNAVDNAPDLVNHVLGESSFLMEILFDPSKIKQYTAYRYPHVTSGMSITSGKATVDPMNFLSIFNSIKDDFSENHLFIGNMLYYVTRLILQWAQDGYDYPNPVYKASESQKTIHKDFSEWTNEDFIAFHSWRTLYYFHVNGNCVLLKDWLYNSNIFMTKYILFLLHRDINSYASLEEICADDALFNEVIHSDDVCNMAFYSPLFISIIGESKKNLNALYSNFAQVQKNLAVTSNQDQLNNFVSAAATLRNSSLCVHKSWHVSDVDLSLNGFTSSSFERIDERRCLIIDIYNISGTNAYGYNLGEPREPSITGANTEVNLLKFANYLELKAPGKIDYVDYIPLDG